IVVLTGGYRSNPKQPLSVSTDSQVVKGIEDLPGVQPSLVEKRLRILQPDPAKDRNDAARYKPEDTKGTVAILEGSTARQRRLNLVPAATAMVTIKGFVPPAMVPDAALAVGKPFLPLPFTGGDSRESWDDYKDRICRWFRIPAEVAAEIEG